MKPEGSSAISHILASLGIDFKTGWDDVSVWSLIRAGRWVQSCCECPKSEQGSVYVTSTRGMWRLAQVNRCEHVKAVCYVSHEMSSMRNEAFRVCSRRCGFNKCCFFCCCFFFKHAVVFKYKFLNVLFDIYYECQMGDLVSVLLRHVFTEYTKRAFSAGCNIVRHLFTFSSLSVSVSPLSLSLTHTHAHIHMHVHTHTHMHTYTCTHKVRKASIL